MFQEFLDGASELATKAAVATNDAADQASRATKRAFLQGRIQYLEHQIKTTQQQFGVAVWNAMDRGELDECQVIFSQFKNETDELNKEIAEKREEIFLLSDGAAASRRSTFDENAAPDEAKPFQANTPTQYPEI